MWTSPCQVSSSVIDIKLNNVCLQGRGFPDINTRFLLRTLWNMFAIPILVLVDADPHGIEIMAVYKFGSKSLSYDTDYLAVPSIKWLGILPSDITRYKFPSVSSMFIKDLENLVEVGRDILNHLLKAPSR
ncbi:endodeoxyribonuclease [Mactra antiquata]